jgi:copper chaperone NosL
MGTIAEVSRRLTNFDYLFNINGMIAFSRVKARVPGGPVKSLALAVLVTLTLSACKEEAAKPEPQTLTDEAIGRYCGMMLAEHEGPKGQVFIQGIPEPLWFSSVRDAVAFTLLPEEPKDIAAIYVSDMGAAASWADPGPNNWTDARTASFVIGGTAEGGMGGAEAVPFADKARAETFAAETGGRVVTFDAIPSDYVLGDQEPNPLGEEEPHDHGN